MDSTRTLTIWAISLLLGWEEFNWLQAVGFVLLVSGTLIFNEIVIIPWTWFSKNTKVMAGIDDDAPSCGDRLSSLRYSSLHQKAV